MHRMGTCWVGKLLGLLWASQVWSPWPRQAWPEGTEHSAALITKASCCYILWSNQCHDAVQRWVPQPRWRWQRRQWLCSLARCNTSAVKNMGSQIKPSVSLLVCSLQSSLLPVSDRILCIWDETNSVWILRALIRFLRQFPLKIDAMNTRSEMGSGEQFLPACDSANSQLENSSLPAVCAHLHWLHVHLNEVPQWLWKHTLMVGCTLSTDHLYCVRHHSPVMTLNLDGCCLSLLCNLSLVTLVQLLSHNNILSDRSSID